MAQRKAARTKAKSTKRADDGYEKANKSAAKAHRKAMKSADKAHLKAVRATAKAQKKADIAAACANAIASTARATAQIASARSMSSSPPILRATSCNLSSSPVDRQSLSPSDTHRSHSYAGPAPLPSLTAEPTERDIYSSRATVSAPLLPGLSLSETEQQHRRTELENEYAQLEQERVQLDREILNRQMVDLYAGIGKLQMDTERMGEYHARKSPVCH